MNDHVGKPIERAKLYNSIRRWLPGTKGRRARVRSASSHLDNDEIRRIRRRRRRRKGGTHRYRNSLTSLRRRSPPHCTLSDAQRAAHALVNCAGVLGMENLVAACRALQFVSRDDVNHQIVAMDELRREQSAARQTLMGALLPRLRDRLFCRRDETVSRTASSHHPVIPPGPRSSSKALACSTILGLIGVKPPVMGRVGLSRGMRGAIRRFP